MHVNTFAFLFWGQLFYLQEVSKGLNAAKYKKRDNCSHLVNKLFFINVE